MLELVGAQIIESLLFTSFLNINSLSKNEQKINMHEQEKLKKEQKQAKNDRERNILIGTLCPLRSVCVPC